MYMYPVHILLSGKIMQAKALDFHRQLSVVRDLHVPTTSFTASVKSLWRFCKQHRIRQLSLCGEKASRGKPAVELFVSDFQAFLGGGGKASIKFSDTLAAYSKYPCCL